MISISREAGRFTRWTCLAVALCLLASCQAPSPTVEAPTAAVPALPRVRPVEARDAFVVLSGGGTPLSNNYSQYVQARAMAGFLRENFPPEAVWVFFGQGNRDGESATLADVYRRVKRDGALLESWLPGSLPENRPATRENFLRALRAEILPRVRSGGTLYLFVGDHGELTRGRNAESAITMWGMREDAARSLGWVTERNYALRVSELQQALTEGLGAGRVVFCMTQCHSGGFHDLGLPSVKPERAWFTSAPKWAASGPARLLPVAGFTATDAASVAAGCDPDPDPDGWAGYERFLPEALLGFDLLRGTRLGEGRGSFAEAHAAAVLVDPTIDKPRATSEQFLERWATLIEKQLAPEPTLTAKARQHVEHYRRAVETGTASASDPAWSETRVQFERFTARMIEQNGALKNLLLTGDRAALEAAIAGPAHAPGEIETEPAARRLSRPQTMAWRNVIRPAWQKAVLAGEVVVPPVALELEKRMLAAEERGRAFAFADSPPTRVLDDIYWSSTYAVPARFEPATAETVTRWVATRGAKILAWATASEDAALREAAARFPASLREPATTSATTSAARTVLGRDTAAERTLFYRRVLAAWAFLIAMDDQPALAQLRALRELERTPLPLAAKVASR